METEREVDMRLARLGEYPDEIEGYHGCPFGAAVVALNCGATRTICLQAPCSLADRKKVSLNRATREAGNGQ
jgi:hypothetical protein